MDKLYFSKVRENAIIPSKRDSDGGYDIYANFEDEYIVIRPNEIKLIPTGIASAFNEEYVMLGRERGSTGTKGMSLRCMVIDSNYRGEWFVPINNTSNKPIVILKDMDDELNKLNLDFVTIYPYEKAICQTLLVPVPKVEVNEISLSELKNMKSVRGEGFLGSTNK